LIADMIRVAESSKDSAVARRWLRQDLDRDIRQRAEVEHCHGPGSFAQRSEYNSMHGRLHVWLHGRLHVWLHGRA